jgi:hypothetical protein
MTAKGQPRSEFPDKINRAIYDQQVMFKVRALQREEFFRPLGLRLSLIPQHQSNAQTLHIELTDDQDPLFLFQMVCTEQDFHILK